MTISVGDVPLLPIDESNANSFAKVYLLHDILNNLQPGLGDEYMSQYPAVEAWAGTQLPEFEGSLQSGLDAAGTTIADGISASGGDGTPVTVDALDNKLRECHQITESICS